MLYYIKLFHRKVFKKRFKRFKLALVSRRFNKSIKLPKPAKTRRKKVLFMIRKFYSLVLDKLGLEKILLRFQQKQGFKKQRFTFHRKKHFW